MIGHDGHLVVDLRLLSSREGGRDRPIQSGYRAQWWLVQEHVERWLGTGPIDLLQGRRSLKPGDIGPVALHPMVPSSWQDIDRGDVLHMRERPGRTLGIAEVKDRVALPDEAPLKLPLAPPAASKTLLAERPGRRQGLFGRLLALLRFPDALRASRRDRPTREHGAAPEGEHREGDQGSGKVDLTVT